MTTDCYHGDDYHSVILIVVAPLVIRIRRRSSLWRWSSLCGTDPYCHCDVGFIIIATTAVVLRHRSLSLSRRRSSSATQTVIVVAATSLLCSTDCCQCHYGSLHVVAPIIVVIMVSVVALWHRWSLSSRCQPSVCSADHHRCHSAAPIIVIVTSLLSLSRHQSSLLQHN